MKWGAWPVMAAAAAAFLCQRALDERLGRFRAQQEVLYVWSGEHLQRMAPGFENLLADLYWLRTVQYYGGQRAFAGEKRYELLEPLADITTTLDPHFEIAYRYGAVFLCESYPDGAGEPAAGLALLEKGVRNNPQAWLLWQHLGFFRFLYAGDAAGAAASLMRGAEQPGAPGWLKTLAAALLAQGGEREKSRLVWRGIYESAPEEPMRENAARHLRRLDALDLCDEWNAGVATFRSRAGRNPISARELADEGLVRRPAIDPAGHALSYDPPSGLFSVARDSPVWAAEKRRPGLRSLQPTSPSSNVSTTQETPRPQNSAGGR